MGLTLMKWVYTDQAEIPHDEAFLIELVKAAKKYRLKELKERYGNNKDSESNDCIKIITLLLTYKMVYKKEENEYRL